MPDMQYEGQQRGIDDSQNVHQPSQQRLTDSIGDKVFILPLEGVIWIFIGVMAVVAILLGAKWLGVI